MRPLVTFEDVSRAMHRIRDAIVNTSCNESPAISRLLGMDVFLKKDYRQSTGRFVRHVATVKSSFKERGARNALMQLSREKAANGVIAASAGA